MPFPPTIIPAQRRVRRRRRGSPETPPPLNVNVTRIFLTYEQGIVMLFDGPVAVDQASPPTTWSFHGITSIQPGSGFNFPQGTYFLLNGVVVRGNRWSSPPTTRRPARPAGGM